jgi:hypothetical protein
MAGAGKVNLWGEEVSRAGAETGGAITSAVAVNGTRELAKSRCASRGAGATTAGASEFVVRVLSRETSGAGGTTAAFQSCEVRVLECETSGAGGTMLAVRALGERLADGFNSDGFKSGEGGMALVVGRNGVVRVERRPSAGGGPGLGLNASRFATAESECGRLTLGASTTFSAGCSPRTTRIVWVG